MRKYAGALFWFVFSTATGQIIVTPDSYQSYNYDFLRLETDTSNLNLHYTIKEAVDEYFQFLDPIVKIGRNSSYAYGANDGAVWKGKGLNTELHFGFSGSVGILTYTFQPVYYYSENKSYRLANQSGSNNQYNYQFPIGGQIDWVQRYGDNALSTLNLGQSEIKIKLKGFKLALGTQNFTLGPGVHFPILMSNNAAGIPNINFGTDGAINLHFKDFQLAKLEFNVIYGLMQESKYFDESGDNDLRYLNALNIAIQPSIAPNLTFGFGKVLYKQTKYFDTEDLLSVFYEQPEPVKVINGDTIRSANDFFDQMLEVNLEWRFPTEGFRVYGSYALNDFNSRPRILEPEHSRAFSLGFSKIFNWPKVQIVTSYERVNLSRNLTYLYRATPTYYIHGFSRQGYTNSGQIMGSSTGPGSNADHVEFKVKLKEKNITFGAFGRRTENNKDYFITHNPTFRKHDVFLDIGFQFYFETEKFIFGADAAQSLNYNRYYIIRNNVPNLYLSLSAQARINN